MPALFVFLFKVNIALLLFCAGYYLVLRHLTFYTLNRIYLVAAILFASIYPKINLSGFLEHHRQIAKPVEVIVLNWQAPAKAFVKPLAQPNYWLWAEVVLWAGVALFALRLLVQLYSLYKLYRSSTAATIHNHDVRVINSDTGPFSFWKSIYINPAKHNPSDLRSILLHEQIHVNELHTLDVLLAELSTIFYWFNPGVWLMKKAVRENIEFITDRKILKNGTDSKQYQYSLVNVSFSAAPQGIVNHFNISTIKKRIIMMNAKRSSKFNLTRYAFLVPAVVALLLVFSISKAALVKKAKPAIKAFTALTSKSIEKNNLKTTAWNTKTTAAAIKSNIALQKLEKKIDTIRKGKFFLSTSDKSDSLNYVINGVKSSKADLLKLDENKIHSVNIVTADDASKLLDHLNNNHGTVFITTDDSESGKKFKEKLDNLYKGNQYTIAGRGNISSGSSSGVTKAIIVTGTSNGSDILMSDNGSNNNTAIAGSGKNTLTVVQGIANQATRSTSSAATLTFRKSTKNDVTVRGYASGKGGDTSKVYYSFTIDSAATHNLNSKPYNIKSGVSYNSSNVVTVFPNQRLSINHLSDKLIIINGKAASESDLKKISAFDIDRMVLKTDDETKELYGDKAKNGVVFIVTKKGAK
jgi:bla regulator protein BlaR1